MLQRFATQPKRGFTLIELLIVVAIIAILAAIAVPNFLEAQTRSKVSRLLADMRTVKTGIESYYVDDNKYPETDYGANIGEGRSGVGLVRLTTPISYLTSIPTSPFQEDNIGRPSGSTNHSSRGQTILYIRAIEVDGNISGSWTAAPNPISGERIDQDYAIDRLVYLKGITATTVPPISDPDGRFAREGGWGMKSVGPDNRDDRVDLMGSARIYDPTNGTVSRGDIVTYQDTSIKAEMR